MKQKIIAVLIISILTVFCKHDNTPKISIVVITYSKLFTDEMSTEISCYRIPALITASDGTLIAAVDERVESCADLKSNKNINIIIHSSSDNRETRTAGKTIYSGSS